MATQQAGLKDENMEAKETTASEFYSTDDESTGQRCSSNKDKHTIHVDLSLEKILSKTKR